MNKDGKITYSATVNVYYDPGTPVVYVYPNPANDVLKVKLNSLAADRYVLAIADVTGRKTYEETIIIAANSQRELDIDLKQKASGIYVLTIRNGKNEIITSQKVVKQ